MRIISGEFKGKKILEPMDKNTRPLKDLTKESIFNILKHSNKLSFDLDDKSILDLFSGVGSFGLEALSRNANYVTFIEKYPAVIKILKKNIDSFNLKSRCEIIEKNIFSDLDFDEFDHKFHLIFLDPPFKEEKVNSLLLKIYCSNILTPDGLLIIHRNSKESHTFPTELNILEKKTYGISQIFFCKFN